MAIARSGKPNSARGHKSRGRGLRTTTGCITCRKRHVKCDEARPVCQTCIRANKSCVYPHSELASDQPPPSSAHEHYSSASAQAETDADAPFVAVESRRRQTVVSESEDHQLDTNSPTATIDPNLEARSVAGRTHEDHPHLSNESAQVQVETRPTLVDLPRGTNTANYTSPLSVGAGSASDQPIGVATARWFGMLAGDADIFIDLSLDAETASQSVLYKSSYEHQPTSDRPGIFGGRTCDETPASGNAITDPSIQQRSAEESLWQSDVSLTLKRHEKTLFHSFVMHISQWIDLFDPYQHFSSLVPRLALHNVGLLNAILALSFRHNSLGKPTAVRS